MLAPFFLSLSLSAQAINLAREGYKASTLAHQFVIRTTQVSLAIHQTRDSTLCSSRGPPALNSIQARYNLRMGAEFFSVDSSL